MIPLDHYSNHIIGWLFARCVFDFTAVQRLIMFKTNNETTQPSHKNSRHLSWERQTTHKLTTKNLMIFLWRSWPTQPKQLRLKYLGVIKVYSKTLIVVSVSRIRLITAHIMSCVVTPSNKLSSDYLVRRCRHQLWSEKPANSGTEEKNYGM